MDRADVMCRLKCSLVRYNSSVGENEGAIVMQEGKITKEKPVLVISRSQRNGLQLYAVL